MAKHPKFIGKPISPHEHDLCVRRLGQLYPKYISPILAGTDLYDRGRWHRKPDAPCVYVFRNRDLYESDQRGIFLHIQNTRDEKGIEIVFRKKKNFSPLSSNEWARLGPERWQPNKDEWKALIVLSDDDVSKARRLLGMAIDRYDEEYNK